MLIARSNFAFPDSAVGTSVGSFMPRLLFYFILLPGCFVIASAQLASVDAGSTAAGYGTQINGQAALQIKSATWVRLWNASGTPHLQQIHQFDPQAQAVETDALSELRYRDIRPILFLRWSERSWTTGIRAGGGQRVPLDLREMYRRGIHYGQTYGATGAAFEIENEPDIAFVQENPETYLGFLKAGYLGIKHGAMMKRAETGRSAKRADGEANLKPEGIWRVSGRPGDGAEVGEQKTEDGAQRTEEASLQTGNAQTPRAKSQAGYSDFTADAFFKLGRPGDRWLSSGRQRDLELTANRSSLPAQQTAPLVVMAPLALPPGPYFEQLVANGLFSYTDAFNYHYYGYAEDFTGVYRQFENALKELSLEPKAVSYKPNSSESGTGRQQAYGLSLSAYRSVKKSLPVLLTEYGYGSLSGIDRDTVEGRVRQWRWFKTVGEQIRDLRIAGPMAFYLPPYFEQKSIEYGLTVRSADSKAETGNLKPEVGSLPEIGNLKPVARQSSQRGDGGADRKPAKEKPETGNLKPESSALGSQFSDIRPQTYSETQVSSFSPQLSNPTFQVSHLTFTPADFGLKKPEPWMHRIGQKFGDNEATPALAWLQEAGSRKPYRPKNWTVLASEPSPVVIDFIAGDGLIQQKRYGGYVVMREGAGSLELGARSSAEGGKPVRNTHVSGLKSRVSDRERPAVKSGSGEIVLYNFSDAPLTGRLEIVQGRELLRDASVIEHEWTLEPMARQVVPVTLTVAADRFIRRELALRFIGAPDPETGRSAKRGDGGANLKPEGSAISSLRTDVRPQVPLTGTQVSGFIPQVSNENHSPQVSNPSSQLPAPGSSLISLFSTFFYPEGSGMKEIMLFDFNSESRGQRAEGGGLISVHSHESTTRRNQALLEKRRLAREEPRLTPAGRWNVTHGMKVEELPDRTWRFHITDFPPEPNKPAMAELPLPDDFSFPDGGMMCFTYRLTQPANTTVANGKYFEPYFRTANGNLYQVWPRQYAMGTWNGYTEVKENFTMAFYNRSNLPWRFRDNRPVALVFVFRPGRASLPATYEVRDMRIVELVAEQGGDLKPET